MFGKQGVFIGWEDKNSGAPFNHFQLPGVYNITNGVGDFDLKDQNNRYLKPCKKVEDLVGFGLQISFNIQ